MIPDYQTVMLPLLRLLADQKERPMSAAVDAISREFSLSSDECQALLPSGTSTVIGSRVGWARTYLKKAGLVDSPKRGVVCITPRGASILQSGPARIDVKFLEQFPEFMEFRTLRHSEALAVAPQADASTPEEALEEAYQEVRASLESDVLARVRAASPAFFERLVVELLVRIGYGGSIRDAGQAVGRSGDGGIDGIIKEDRLGLDLIYIQAKRWENPVGSPEVHKFVGALAQRHAKKGVLITTSGFTKDAREVVGHLESRIVQIDGPTLAALMLDNNVGVSPVAAYEIKKVDTDFFAED
jgi:restriction system protein